MTSIREIASSSQDVNNLFETLGGKWPKEKRFWQLIEEVGELAQEVLEKNKDSILDELGDVCFTYMGYIDGLKKEDIQYRATIRSYIREKTEGIDLTDTNIILLLLSNISRENKIVRAKENRKKYEESEEESLNRQYLILYLLHILTSLYGTSIKECIDASITKFTERDIKK